MTPVVAFALALAVGLMIGAIWVPAQRALGITSRDVYKGVDGVPRAGGVIALAAYLAGLSMLGRWDLAALVVAAGVLGLLDDLVDLHEYVRVGATAVMALAVALVWQVPPIVPGLGEVYSLTILSALAIVVMGNAVNMLDVVNGFMPLSNAVMGAALAIIAAMEGRDWGIFAVHVAASLALYVYNRYPARTFNGNVGSHVLGVALGVEAYLTGLTHALLIAAAPYILHGTLAVVSARGIRGRRRRDPPTEIVNGLVMPRCASRSLTLVKALVAGGPLDEYGIFRRLIAMSATSSILAVAIYAWL